MSIELYYTAPSDDMFNEIKREATKIWETYDDTYGYVSDKLETVNRLQNVRDNYMFMVSMFDWTNQQKLLAALHPDTVHRILEAMR